ncbi:tyrosine-type recombinase/integrase [Yersinia mollaretii]|uniref:tyrosine-type recombinase/integrase n=1 Tax=Yersinia mollaretii TaxID=33060 RepID=UPI0011A2AEA7|nr:tyrosine-type recombinase/integrase [Yersinia mollaretii]
MSIKNNMYLFQRNDGIYVFQVFVPKYMRHLTEGKRVFRRSSGERELQRAQNFRDHMIIEFNKIKNQLKPDVHQIKIQRGITALHALINKESEKQNNVGISSKCMTPVICPTLSQIRDEYLSEYKDKRKLSTLSKTLLAVNLYLDSSNIIDVPMDSIKRTQVAAFIREQKKDKSPQTIQNYLSSLSAIYTYARQVYDCIPSDCPFIGYTLEAKATVISYEPFESHQIDSLLQEAEEEIRDVILIGLYSGMRLDEICSVKRNQVITIEGITCFNISKGKTKSAIRYVPIHSKLIDIVDKYLSLANGEYLLTHANQIKRKDGKIGPYYSQKFTRLRNSVLPLATDRQCFHSLRGMFITELDRQGVAENRIALIVGHGRGKTESFKTYSQGSDLKELAGYIEMVNYKLEDNLC